MNRFDELIAEFCPDGVEYRKLGDIGTFTRGSGIQKKDFAEEGMPCIHYGQIYTKFGLSTNCALSMISKKQYAKSKKANPGDVIFAITSENIEDVCTPLVWEGEQPVAISGHSCAYATDDIVPRYLAYLATGQFFQIAKQKVAKGTKVIEVAPVDLATLEIPVPPIEVQREIVRILDAFAAMTDELADKLTAEVVARKAQYEHYRDRLLSKEYLDALDGKPVEMKTMGELFDMKAGTHIGRSMISENVRNAHCVPCYGGNGLRGYVEKANQSGIALLIGRQGALCGNVCRATGDFYATEHAVVTRCKNELILPNFAYHMLVNRNLNQYKSAGAQPGLAVGKLKTVEFPVPSLTTQQKAVDILDRFDTLTTSLTDGLPAEIEARKAQYAYYRDRLLDFPRKEVAAS